MNTYNRPSKRIFVSRSGEIQHNAVSESSSIWKVKRHWSSLTFSDGAKWKVGIDSILSLLSLTRWRAAKQK